MPELGYTGFDLDSVLENLSEDLGEAVGKPGFAFQVGIEHSGGLGTVVVGEAGKRNTFLELIQGIDAGSQNGTIWKINYNDFRTIYDHAIYLLGALGDLSEITQNDFNKMASVAIKLGDALLPHQPLTPPPGSPPFAGPHLATIASNSFHCLKGGAIFMSGQENTVANNSVEPYSAACGSAYNPAESNYPELWISTDGGQGGYFNHAAYNRIQDNSMTDGSALKVFIDQRPDFGSIESLRSTDRNIECNTVVGATQHVYFRHLVPDHNPDDWTRYDPTLNLEGAQLSVEAPPGCVNCRGSDSIQVYFMPPGSPISPCP